MLLIYLDMIIDWQKYVCSLLPTFMRGSVITELVRTFIWQIPWLFSKFSLWSEGIRYKANVFASKIALEKLLEREFDRIAIIHESDGKPIDFVVTISGLVDENRVKSIVDQHKIAGKSYILRFGSVTHVCHFINYLCEDIIEITTVSFSDHYCEDNGSVFITTKLSVVGANTFYITATASRLVLSNIEVTGMIVANDESGHILPVEVFSVTILAGSIIGSVEQSISISIGDFYFIEYDSIVINPTSDSYFNYLKKQ